MNNKIGRHKILNDRRTVIKIVSLENRRKNIIKIFSILRELLLKRKDRQKRDIHNRRPFPYECRRWKRKLI